MSEQELSTNLRRLRDERNLSSKKLSLKMNVTVRTVNSWLNGDSQPKAGQLYRLCKIFDVTMDEMFSDFDTRRNANKMLNDIDNMISGLHQDDQNAMIKIAIECAQLISKKLKLNEQRNL